MKVLYAIQGTGNGHLSRARTIIPLLEKKNIHLDLLVSGTQADINIPHPIKYRLKGLSFTFGKKGGVDMWRTYLKTNTARLQQEIKKLPVHEYDLVINDFEPVSAWACRLKNLPCIGFSHQSAVLGKNVPKPQKRDLAGRLILRKYAPVTKAYGLHFEAYNAHTFTPVIRHEIRNIPTGNGQHYTVYLPAYSDQRIIKILSQVKGVQWEVFSKHTSANYQTGNIHIRKINNKAFINSLVTSKGVLCGAGFETPAEALHLGKKLLVIPMKAQYEQQCNAAALKEMGVPVVKSLKQKHLDTFRNWVATDTKVNVYYPDITEDIIDKILEETLVMA